MIAQDGRHRASPALHQPPSSWFCSFQGCREVLQDSRWPRLPLQPYASLRTGEQAPAQGGFAGGSGLGGSTGKVFRGNLAEPGGLHTGHSASRPMGGCEGHLCSGPTRVKLAQAQRYVRTELELTLMHTSLRH